MKKIIISSESKSKLKKLLESFSNYKNFSKSKKKAYAFCKEVGLKVCPYCNINYIYTVYDDSGKEILRSDLDHFYSQTDHEDKQLDWDNLIPSCQPCNSRLKGRQKFSEGSHIHPYKEDFDSIKEFVVSLDETDYLDEASFKLEFCNRNFDSSKNEKADRNIEAFKLEDRYQYHKDEVVEIFKKVKFYHKSKTTEIEGLLKTSDLQRVLFPEQYCEINKTSLGKLKKDLIKKYK